MNNPLRLWSDQAILAVRQGKNPVDPERPYAYLVEAERAATGDVVDVATIFLTNRECPFRCLMCDLWKNTTDESVVPGAIPRQINFALARLPPARYLKLYNSGNFFDAKAIPRSDYAEIAQRGRRFERVIVENHPKLCQEDCRRFGEQLAGTEFEIALGLETVHPEVLHALNKQMTLDDFAHAVERLLKWGIAVRAFVLLKPPFLSEDEGVEWALRSLQYAFALGVECCSVIPMRAGNGAIDCLQQAGLFAPPALSSMEHVLEAGIDMRRGRVFMDLWDLDRFSRCTHCRDRRRDRLHQMNLLQVILPPIDCACEDRAL